jgi:hypothetical protein
MLPSLIMLAIVVFGIYEVAFLPSDLRLAGVALLFGLPLLGGLLLHSIANASPRFVAEREELAFVGALGGMIVGAVIVYLLRRARPASEPADE